METIEITRTDTTVSYETWKQFFSEQTTQKHHVYDFDTADFIKDVVVAYLTAPVGYYNEQVITAKTMKIERLVDWITLKNELLKSGKKIILYMILLVYPFPIYYEVDRISFEAVSLGDNARMSSGYWVLRYAEI